MTEIVTQPSIDPDYRYESRAGTNSSGTAPSTPSSSSDYVTGEADDSSESKATVPFTLKSVDALLSISKAASPDDLQEMVENCKRMVLESAECSEERKWLVRRLIELRLRAQELRETSGDNLMETQVMLGHHLVPQKYYIATSGPTYCDHCSGAIWTMLQSWYMCRDCSFCSHWKCINDIRRVCAHVVASETGGYTYTKDICPEKGLSAQGYRCAECHTRITFKSAWVEPRLCDYSGLFYCQRCHWNSMAVIPARVVRNWDMEPRKVCRSASQLLALLEDRPVLPLEQLNPKLFTLIPDLTLIKIVKRSNDHEGLVRHVAWLLAAVVNLYLYNYMSQVLMDRSISIRYYIYNGEWYRLSPKVLQILHFMMMRCNVSCNLTAGKISRLSVQTFGVRLREELQMMKRYLVFCPDADFQGLPWRTGLRTHLIENSSNYSMKDIVDLQSGVLMEEIRSAYDAMRNHITDVCELCRARGHLCELCGNDEVIYPWDTSAISCQQCAAVHHRVCWAKRNNCCPRCTRIQQRLAMKSQETIDDVEDTLTNDRH